MREQDFEPFVTMLDAVCGLLSRGAYRPSAENSALWFRALAAFDLDAVRAAFDAHVKDPQRGRFVPVPADVIAQLGAAALDDGRPGAEEAWAITVGAADEATTVVWTDEMAEAWGIALPVLRLGDEVGARMAFKEAYGRLLSAARASGGRARWSATLGSDPAGRDRAIAEAARLGRIAASPSGAVALPPPRGEVLLLDGETQEAGGPSEGIRAKLLALRDAMTAQPTGPSAADLERADTARRKAAAAERVAAYAAQSSEAPA